MAVRPPPEPLRVSLQPRWRVGRADDAPLDATPLLELLATVQATGSIAQAGREAGLSYRHAWGLLRQAEALFGEPLLLRGRGRGSALTGLGEKLVWADARIGARLQPLLESLASELEGELGRVRPHAPAVARLHASHGFAVEGLMQAAGQADTLALELRYRTGIEALASLESGDCDLAGFQVPVGELEAPMLRQYSEWLNPEEHRLIHLAVRNTGMFVKPGNPKNIMSIADLARSDVRFVNRQMGSSTRYMTGLMLRRFQIDPIRVQGFDNSEFTHMAIATHIASGMADVGIGVETAAWRCGLDFIALARERYFFATHRDVLATPPMRRLLELMQGDAYRTYVSQLVGYDAAEMGKVQTLDEAFGPEFAEAGA